MNVKNTQYNIRRDEWKMKGEMKFKNSLLLSLPKAITPFHRSVIDFREILEEKTKTLLL